jgi:DNA-binding SARP family transcriptional activator
MYVAEYSLGYLDELAQETGSRYMEQVKGQWRVAALRAMGRTEQALDALAGLEGQRGTLSLQAWIAPLVLIDAGRGDEARAQLERGRGLVQASGQIAVEAMNRLVHAKLALRIDDHPAAARAILDEPAQRKVATDFAFIGEVADTWYGHALLRESRDADALTRLRRAVHGMSSGGRLLELPTAAVYLAEAEWRAGDEDAADAAADLALAAAQRQGSNHALLQALTDYPAVAARRIDAEPAPGSPWHELGRALRAQGARVATRLRASVELQEFGTRRLLIDGAETRPKITKAYELLAFLATRQPELVARDEAMSALFDASVSASARAYLRQALHWLRQVLPEGGIRAEGGRVGLAADLLIATDSMQFTGQLAAAGGRADAERLAATLAALEIYDRGEYLPGRRSEWGDQREQELRALALDGRYDAAELSLSSGDYAAARALARQVLAAEPYHEPAWRLLMRIEHMLGDEQAVVRTYRECERSMAAIGVTPSASTRRLLESLRP